MLKQVYFYAVDPGALSVMQAIIDSSPDNVKCYWVAEGYAKSIFDSKGIEYFDIRNIETNLEADNVFVLGSQINTSRTAELIKSFFDKNIKTIFLFDHWCNYSKHFTLPNGSFALPTRIFVMDEYVKSKLIKLGIDESIIRIVGYPGIEFEVNQVKGIISHKKQEIEKKIGVAFGEKIILLALEPLSEDFPVESLNYDEYSITLLVHQAIQELESENIQLVVRLHPRQSKSKYSEFVKAKRLNGKIIICPEKVSLAESLSIADMVIGMYSVFLIIALVLGKQTISLQFNAKDTDPNWNIIQPLERVKISSPAKLSTKIHEKLNQEPEQKLSLSSGSVKKAWDEIRMLI
jgi:hypothetical protein